MKKLSLVVAITLLAAVCVSAQQTPDRAPSPPGTAATVVGGEWVKNAAGDPVYQGGKWIEVIYSRPILRQRQNIFGSGADYGKGVLAGAPVWRAGANQTTVLKTEVPLTFGGTTVPAGEYGLLADLKAGAWTLILTSQKRQAAFDANNTTDLIGANNYDPKFDVLRAPMEVTELGSNVDQLTILFTDVTKDSGKLAIVWGHTMATAEFKVGR